MDFNQVDSRGLKRMMQHVLQRGEEMDLVRLTNQKEDPCRQETIEVVLIGHSKTFIPYNEQTLEPFLSWWRNRQSDCVEE